MNSSMNCVFATTLLALAPVVHAGAEATDSGDAHVPADFADRCRPQLTALDDLRQAAQQEGEAIERDAQGLGEGSDFSIDFKVEWETVDVRFHVPEYQGMKRQDFSMHLPKFSSKRHRFSFDVPELRWEQTKVAPYFRCSKWRCRKEYIKTNVPKWYHKRVDGSWDVPTVTWGRTDFAFDLPQFGRNDVTWKFDVPRFRVREVRIGDKPVYAPELDDKANALKARGEAMEEKYEKAFAVAEVAATSCFADVLDNARKEVAAQFDAAVTQLESARDTAAASKMTSISDEDSKPYSFDEKLAELRQQRTEALQAIDAERERLAASMVSTAP